MGSSAVCLSIVLGMMAPGAGSTRTTLPGPVEDGGAAMRLQQRELTFARTSTLYILGKGRLGTWSVIGSSVGGTLGCSNMAVRCFDLAVAQVGIAWRPFGSLVSLFSAIGVSVVPGTYGPPGFQVTSGLRVDLPSRLGWRR